MTIVKALRLAFITGVLGAAGLTLVTGVSYATSEHGSESTSDTVRELEISPSTSDVSATELWNATLDALECFESHEVRTIGPYPASDGSRVRYSVQITNSGAETASATCTEQLESMSFRFALDNPPEPASGPVPDSELGSVDRRAEPATAEGEALVAIRDDLGSCLVGAGVALGPDDPLDPDAAFLAAAHDQSEQFDDCVTQVGKR